MAHRAYNTIGSSPKELIQVKDSRIPGVQDSSVMLRNYKGLNVWKKSYKQGCKEIAKSDDQIPVKQALESLTPWILGPFFSN